MWKIDRGSLSGALGAEYAGILDWNTSELDKKTIVLKNTHAVQTLKYRLRGFALEGGTGFDLVAESLLAAGETAVFQYEQLWGRLVLQAAALSGSAAYQVDYTGQGA